MWYWTEIMNDWEQRLDTTYREWLAVVWAVLILRLYLEGSQFTIWTDHHALNCILNLADVTEKLAKRHLRLIEYSINKVQRALVAHQAADALWRLNVTRTEDFDISDDIRIIAVTTRAPKVLSEVTNDTPKTPFWDKRTTLSSSSPVHECTSHRRIFQQNSTHCGSILVVQQFWQEHTLSEPFTYRWLCKKVLQQSMRPNISHSAHD